MTNPDSTPTDAVSRPGARALSIVASVLLCVVLILVMAFALGSGLILGLNLVMCPGGDAPCANGGFALGAILGFFGPLVIAIVAIVWTIVRLVRRQRLAWVIPIGGVVAVVLVAVLSALVVSAGTGESFTGWPWF